jgi:hypothetical protein
MSTGAAGAAASGGQGDGGGAATQGDGGGDGGADLNQLAAGLAAQQATQQEMYDYLRAQPWAQAEGQQQGQQEATPTTAQPDALDLSFLNMDDPQFDPGQMAERLGSLIESTVDQRVQQGIQQAVNPVNERVQQMQREAEAAALVGEFPEFGEQETAQAVLQTAGQLAQAAGHPELANEPWLWRLTYMAGRAADAAQEEQGDTPAPGHMESGSGATPGGSRPGMTADDIVGAKRGASVLPFG